MNDCHVAIVAYIGCVFKRHFATFDCKIAHDSAV